MTQARQEANQKLRDALSRLLTPEQQEDIYGDAFLPDAEAEVVFTSRDSKQVWQTSAVGQTYLNVKASHELVLGDSVGVGVTRANIYRLKLAHDDKALFKYPAPAGTPADDSEGPRITSLRGISSQVTMGQVLLQEEDLYLDHDTDSRAKVSSRMNVPHVKQASLAYADVCIASAKQMVKAQWLDARQDFPALQNCQYASLTLSSADPLGPDLQSGISLEVKATGSEQSKKFFDAKGMQG
jgi:hypothetical protein